MDQHPLTQSTLYTDHAVAFMDIVAFEEKVRQSLGCPTQIKAIADALFGAQAWLNTLQTHPTQLRPHMFSDTVVITAPDSTVHSLLSLELVLTNLQCSFAAQGHLVTGCLAAGLLYESGSVMFGPAMIEAYHGQAAASWPRILVAPSTLLRLSDELGDPTQTLQCQYLIKGADGLTYIDYLLMGCLTGTAQFWANDRSDRQPHDHITSFLSHHKKTILQHTASAADKLTKLRKCHALATYHNRTVECLLRSFTGRSQDIKYSDPNLEFLRYFADLAFGRSTQPMATEDAARFIDDKTAALSAASGHLSQCFINIPATFPSLYGFRTDKHV